ncbi:MAG: hypothetical protein ACT4P1_08860 [Sporichthyaceae bacterium]
MIGAPWTLAIDVGARESFAVISAGGKLDVVAPEAHRSDGHSEDAAAGALARLYARACAVKGWPPAIVRLVHPVRWDPEGVEFAALHSAARRVGLPNVSYVLEPVAAAALIYRRYDLEADSRIAICDIAGGRVDCAVMERVGMGFAFVGAPGGRELPGGDVLLGPEQVGAAVAELSAAISRAEVTPRQLAGIYLVGTPSKGSQFAARVQDVTGVAPHQVGDPEHAVAMGAVTPTATDAGIPTRRTGAELARFRPPRREFDEQRENLYWEDWAGQIALVIVGGLIAIALITRLLSG